MTTVDALPVVLELAGPAAGRIRRHLEGELGWQPVETGGGVETRVRIVDVPAAGHVAASAGTTWLVVTDEDEPALAAAAAVRLGSAAVIAWPPGDGAFLAAARSLPETAPVTARPELRVGGAAGGVGCTTIALALGGLLAWDGARTLVVTHGVVPHPVGVAIEPESLHSPDVGRVSRAVRGVPLLSLLHTTDAAADVAVHVEGHEVVRDVGTASAAVDVLVVRRDPAGLAAVADTVAGTVVVTDSGVVPVRAIREAAAGRRVVVLPWSVRVGRAAALGRVPASLPGTWLRTLATATSGHPQAGAGRS